MLADAQAGDRCRRGPEFAADLGWRVGLHVPGIEVTGTTIVEKKDAGLDAGRPGGCVSATLPAWTAQSVIIRIKL